LRDHLHRNRDRVRLPVQRHRSVTADFVSLESVDAVVFPPPAACSPMTTSRRSSSSTTTQTRMHSTARRTRLPVLRKRRPRFREPPPVHQCAPRTPHVRPSTHAHVLTRRQARPSAPRANRPRSRRRKSISTAAAAGETIRG
jgi:hypothetical protein